MAKPEYACAQAWAALSAAHGRVAGRLAAALAQEFGLTVNDFEILLRLHRAPGLRLRLGELNQAVPLTQPALSRAVTRLADRGLLVREGASDDGRGVFIVLQPGGSAVLDRAAPVHAQVIREALLDHLSAAEQQLLADVLRRVAGQPSPGA
jgi:DNA-binding MarR family transcriptional regulator